VIFDLLSLPVPVLLIALGALAVFLGLGGRIKGIIERIPKDRRGWALGIGAALILAGVLLFVIRPEPPGPEEATQTPAPLAMEPSSTAQEAAPTDTPGPAPPSPTIPPASSTPAPEDTVAISEGMFDACGASAADATDEYLELFNYGDEPVDLHGYWLTDGTPQRIVPWSEMNPFLPLEGVEAANQSTWTLPPQAFGLVLTPDYELGLRPYRTRIPPATVILTIDLATGSRLGGGDGFVGSAEGIESRSVVILYRGSQGLISRVVSTYGTPDQTGDPTSIQDDGADDIPLLQGDCFAAHRKVLAGRDVESNWVLVEGGSPGEGIP